MLATSNLLAQLRPMTDDLIETAFTASILTEVTLIIICNNANNARGYSIYHDDIALSFDLDTALYIETSVPGNSTVKISALAEGAGISVAKGGSLAVASTLGGALTFSIYGTTARVTGYGGNL